MIFNYQFVPYLYKKKYCGESYDFVFKFTLLCRQRSLLEARRYSASVIKTKVTYVAPKAY